MGGIMRGMDNLQLVMLDQRAVEISTLLEPWLRLWWVNRLVMISASDWFEQKEDKILWEPLLTAAENALEFLLEALIKNP